MRAIILAAGEGTRLRPHTANHPKCLVELGGRSLLTLQLAALGQAKVLDVTVVTGWKGEQIKGLVSSTRHNARYADSNMVASLMCAADLLCGDDDVLIAYGDIVYESDVVASICNHRAPLSTVVDLNWMKLWSCRMDDPLADAETLKMDGRCCITEIGKRPSSLGDIQAQYIGLTKIRADICPQIVDAYLRIDEEARFDGRDQRSMYMTDFLQHIIDQGQSISAVQIQGGWLEVDTADDLETYHEFLAQGHLGELCKLPLAAGTLSR